MTFIAPAMRGFLKTKPILSFAGITPATISTAVAVPCAVVLPAGSAYAEFVSITGGTNGGFSTTATPVKGSAATAALTITNGMALWGRADAPATHGTTVVVTVRVRTVAGGTILGTYTFNFITS
jgi:hypothetical protein